MKKLYVGLSIALALMLNGCGNTAGTEKNDNGDIQNTPYIPPVADIMINEIMAANKETINEPEFGKSADYIELYNDASEVVDLSGYGLSDKEDGDSWKFPAGTQIEAKSYLLVWADKEDTQLHTDFKLSADGEMVVLYNKSGEQIDKVVFGKQYDDIGVGRDVDGNLVYLKPTPNKANAIASNKIDHPEQGEIEDTPPVEYKTGLVISEFMASNVNTVIDTDYYQFGDWIELYNNSDEDINIRGYTVSDKNDTLGWKIETDVVVPAKGFITIWADKEAGGLHTDFSLSSNGEAIYLYDSDKQLLDSVVYGDQKSNISFGRDLESFEWGYMLPSFEKVNTTLYSDDRAKKPDFSIDEGFYTSATSLEISSEDGGEIRFTVDGSIPNQQSPLYTSPIMIDTTMVVKSIAYVEDKLPSKVKTGSYFIGEASSLPIVSLSTNDDYLFDDMVGMYVKGTNGAYRVLAPDDPERYNFEQDWFRPVHFSIFVGEEKVYSDSMEFAISGAASRYWNDKKSFRFEVDKEVDYKLYPGKDLVNIKDFKLRTGHNAYQIGDLLVNNLVEVGGLNVEYQAHRTVNMFMNGEFWGVYNIREKKGSEYFGSNYPDIGDLDIVKSGGVKEGDRKEHDDMRAFIKSHDLSIAANYAEALEMIDEDNFIDYLCVSLYSANDDWVGSNNRIWKEKKEGAKWRWMLDDVDRGFQFSNVDKNMFEYVANYPVNTLLKEMFNAFSQNASFKAKLKSRYLELLDGTLSINSVRALADTFLNERATYIVQGRFATRESSFNTYVSNLRNFIAQRDAVVRANIEAY